MFSCCCDHDLDPMTFIYKLDPYYPYFFFICKVSISNHVRMSCAVFDNKRLHKHQEVYQMCKYELSKSRLLIYSCPLPAINTAVLKFYI